VLHVERVASGDVAGAERHLGSGGGGVYRLLRDGDPLWAVSIGFDNSVFEYSRVPFHDEVVWERAGVVAVGGGDRVYLLDIQTGDLRREVEVPSLFCELALAGAEDGQELLLILGWSDVHALGRDLSTRWVARHVALDGLTFERSYEGTCVVHAEMDPPGGWFEVTLDACDGHEVGRKPAFSPDYVGWYRSVEE
jgi:hypothetical protein